MVADTTPQAKKGNTAQNTTRRVELDIFLMIGSLGEKHDGRMA